MIFYNCTWKNGEGLEFQNKRYMRKAFKEEKSLFNRLVEEGSLICSKINEYSRIDYKILPVSNGYILFKEYNKEYANNSGDYGN